MPLHVGVSRAAKGPHAALTTNNATPGKPFSRIRPYFCQILSARRRNGATAP